MAASKRDNLDPKKFYRLKYIGQYFPQSVNREKMIEVYYQQLEGFNPNFSDRPLLKGEDVFVEMNLRGLPNLRVGSIYLNDNIVCKHNRFGPQIDLEINVSEGIEMKLSELIDIKDTDYFNLTGLLESKVWVFEKVKGEFIKPFPGTSSLDLVIIPSYEILRFYYGYTSNLVSALFNGGLHTNEIYYPELSTFQYKDGNIVPFIMLGKKIEDKCAKTVARMVFDDTAHKNAEKIYDSLLETRGYNKYPSSGFPFNDNTTLKVNYERLKVGKESNLFIKFPSLLKKKEVKIGLVTEILSCTHEFPFSDLDFLRINDARSIVDKVDHELDKRPPRSRKKRNSPDNSNDDSKPEDDSKKPPLPNTSETEERDNELEPIKEIIDNDVDPFPNATFEAKKVDKEDQKTTTKIIVKLVNDTNKRTKGEGGVRNSGVVGKDAELTDIVLDRKTEVDFNSLISYLNDIDIKTEDCELNGGQAGYSYFTKDKIKNDFNEWCFVNETIRRKCFLVECCWENKYFYLLEIQKRLKEDNTSNESLYMAVFWDAQNGRISDTSLCKFLGTVAEKRGMLKHWREELGCNVFGIRHLKKDTEETLDRVDRILSKLKGIIEPPKYQKVRPNKSDIVFE